MLVFKIYQLERGHPLLKKVENLFFQFYEGMIDQGLLLRLVKDGEKFWINSLEQRLGTFSALFVAEVNNEIVGFSTGSIKIIPKFLGSDKVGFVDAIFVTDLYRGTEIAKNLYGQLETWFASKDAISVELQVLPNNIAGVSFWKKNGYNIELFQMRKPI